MGYDTCAALVTSPDGNVRLMEEIERTIDNRTPYEQKALHAFFENPSVTHEFKGFFLRIWTLVNWNIHYGPASLIQDMIESDWDEYQVLTHASEFKKTYSAGTLSSPFQLTLSQKTWQSPYFFQYFLGNGVVKNTKHLAAAVLKKFSSRLTRGKRFSRSKNYPQIFPELTIVQGDDLEFLRARYEDTNDSKDWMPEQDLDETDQARYGAYLFQRKLRKDQNICVFTQSVKVVNGLRHSIRHYEGFMHRSFKVLFYDKDGDGHECEFDQKGDFFTLGPTSYAHFNEDAGHPVMFL